MQLMQKDLLTLFMVRITTSLCFSVMFTSLALYLSSSFSLSETKATNLVASFLALNYTLPLLAGFIGNRYIDFKKMFYCGMAAQCIADWIFAFHSHANLNLGLALFLMGTMVSTVSIVFFVNELTGADSQFQRRAMLWNYVGMNIGFLLGSFLSGLFGLFHNYSALFIIMSCMPLLSIVLFARYLTVTHKPTHPHRWPFLLMLLIIITLTIAILILLHFLALDRRYLLATSCIGIIALFSIAVRRGHTKLISILLFYMLLSICFWSLYLMTPETILDVMEQHANLMIGTLPIAPQWIEIIDSAVIIFGSPLLALAFKALQDNYKLKVPTSILFGLAFIILTFACFIMSHHAHFLSANTLPLYLFIIYIGLLALAEVFIGPEGYNLPRALSASDIRGIATGAWVSSLGVASLISSYLGDRIDVDGIAWSSHLQHLFHPLMWFFAAIALLTLCVGFILDRVAARQRVR